MVWHGLLLAVAIAVRGREMVTTASRPHCEIVRLPPFLRVSVPLCFISYELPRRPRW